MKTFRIGQFVRIRENCLWDSPFGFPSPGGMEAIITGRGYENMPPRDYKIFIPGYLKLGATMFADAWELEPATLSPDLVRESATELTT